MTLLRNISERSHGNVPRVHGNGFIQLDLEPGARLHIWGHPALPRQKVDTGIHDHRFGFRSCVVVGRIVNAMWVTTELMGSVIGATHKVYQPAARDGEDTTLSDTGRRVIASIHYSQTVLREQTYYMEPGDFHETFTDRPSATIMTKERTNHSHVARVLVPVDREPDNDFNRNDAMSEARLWKIIEEVLSS